MNTHPLDAATLAVTPVVVAPKYGALAPLAGNAQRYVVARDGLYLEVRRAWIHLCVPVGLAAAPTPYGTVQAHRTMLCGQIPRHLLDRFKGEAAQAVPNEHAAWITWGEKTGEWRYRKVGIKSVTPVRVVYDTPALEEGEWRVLDLHSHGRGAAGFSPTDDQDDHGAVKIAMVVGHCDRPEMSMAVRLCALGAFIDGKIDVKEPCHEA